MRSIYDLLTSQRAILPYTVQLPEEIKQLVNKLVNNNCLSNPNETNIVNTEPDNNVTNNSNKEFVLLGGVHIKKI